MIFLLFYLLFSSSIILTLHNRALNSIVSKAKGLFVAFIDAGDYPKKEWIEDLISVQARTQADVVMPMLTSYNDDEVPRRFKHHVPIGINLLSLSVS